MRSVRLSFIGAFVAASLAAGSVTARAADLSAQDARATLEQALAERSRGNLGGVIPLLDPVIAAFEAMQAKGPTFCAENQQQTMMILLMAASDIDKGKAPKPGASTVVVDEAYCTALFLKGFVLIDTGHPAEAEGFLRRAHEAEPHSAHFLNEYAEWHKTAGQWQRAHDLFAEAVGKAEMANDSDKGPFKARALRGMGFTEIELGKLGDAERHMRESQKYEPDSEAAKRELEYIASMRRRRSS